MNVGIKHFSGGGLSGKLGLLNVVIYGKLDNGGTLVEVEFSKDCAIRTQAHHCCSLANLNGVRKIEGEVAGVVLMLSYELLEISFCSELDHKITADVRLIMRDNTTIWLYINFMK